MTQYSEPALISQAGSTRATAYVCGNKSITRGGITYVTWLDAVSKVRFRTYDHRRRTWGPTQLVDTGADNHANPALTISADGHLSMAFGPHGHHVDWNQGRFRHVVSENSVDRTPGEIGRWLHHHYPGYGGTYASLVNNRQGRDCLVYRGGEAPYSLLFQRQREQGGWTQARELFAQEIPPQYTQYLAILAVDSRDTLYVCGHIYRQPAVLRTAETARGAVGESLGLFVLKSSDEGGSWTDLRGEPAVLPATAAPRYLVPGTAGAGISGMCVDHRDRVWVLADIPELPLSCWDGKAWQSRSIARFLPPDRVPEADNIVVDANGRIHIVASLKHRDAPADAWSDPSREVFHLQSDDDGASFSCHQLSPGNPETCFWLPSISQSGPHHAVADPVIVYTAGMQGEGCAPPTQTEVYCVFVDNGGAG